MSSLKLEFKEADNNWSRSLMKCAHFMEQYVIHVTFNENIDNYMSYHIYGCNF